MNNSEANNGGSKGATSGGSNGVETTGGTTTEQEMWDPYEADEGYDEPDEPTDYQVVYTTPSQQQPQSLAQQQRQQQAASQGGLMMQQQTQQHAIMGASGHPLQQQMGSSSGSYGAATRANMAMGTGTGTGTGVMGMGMGTGTGMTMGMGMGMQIGGGRSPEYPRSSSPLGSPPSPPRFVNASSPAIMGSPTSMCNCRCGCQACSAPPTYQLSPRVAELLPGGAVQLRPLAEKTLASSVASLAMIDRVSSTARAETPGKIAAREIIAKLHTKFVEVSSYNYEQFHPSHRWEPPTECITVQQLIVVIEETIAILQNEPTLLRQKPPVYVLGDLHGNYKDLVCFAKAFGLWDHFEIVPAKFLLLGDYVDRGPHSIETIALLFALKVLIPTKIFLLRGNHESKEINGDTHTYKEGSLLWQCQVAYPEQGELLWKKMNKCFRYLPIASVIDNRIFCVHAGIPRALTQNNINLLNEILATPRPVKVLQSQFVFDLLWADPATEDDERKLIGKNLFPRGFGANPRGTGTCLFGKLAVKIFFEQSGCSHIIRAHQYPHDGIQLAKMATTVTVFSSSHYCGNGNKAASVLVHNNTLELIISNTESAVTIPPPSSTPPPNSS
ncbi:serine/threonine protein phosphatase [Pelomyxa schiedti]|nr:serine/threonine protein phosphatase [Pelomyxa schiedti]